MGIAKQATEQVDGGATLSISMETGSENTRWGGQIDTTLEGVTSTGAAVSEADTVVTLNVEGLQEEWQSSCYKKRGWETAEGEPPPKQLKKQLEETDHQEASGMFLFFSL